MAVEDGRWLTPARFNFTRDVVEALARERNRRALTFVDGAGVIERLTFGELAGRVARWAGVLRATGVQPGDRVLVLVGKSPAWQSIMLAALKIGAVTVPCSEMLRARDLTFRARHSRAALLVADRACEGEIRRMEEPPPVLYVDEAERVLPRQPATAATEDTEAADTAFILYTSGTTREPKGVMHTHAYCFAKAMQAEHWLGAGPGDRVWCTAGTGWAKSIWNVLLGPWSRGAEVVMHGAPFDPAERLELLSALDVTVLCQAPTEYRLMAKLDELADYDLSRLRHAVSAGEPLNPEAIKAFRDAVGVTIHDGYGQTENTLLVANCLDATEIRPGSMGLPTPGHEVAVIDGDGRELPPGEEGDIALRGRPPSLFVGYWDAPDETKAAFRKDWYVTGDRAVRDEDGYFWFTGRADDVILTAAYRVGPFEVESALLEHPAVAESAVVGKPDLDRGQIVKAFVVLRPGHEPGDELVHELQEHAKSVTAPYKYPREIEFVDSLPKTRSGKIRRIELRALEERRGSDVLDALDAPRRAEESIHAAEVAEQRLDEERRRAAEAEAEAQERRAAEQRARLAEAGRREAERAEKERAKAERQRLREEEKRAREEEKRAREEERQAQAVDRATAERSEQEEEEARRAAERAAEKQRKIEKQLQRYEARRRKFEESQRKAQEKRVREEEKRRAKEEQALAERQRREEQKRLEEAERAEAERLKLEEREAREEEKLRQKEDKARLEEARAAEERELREHEQRDREAAKAEDERRKLAEREAREQERVGREAEKSRLEEARRAEERARREEKRRRRHASAGDEKAQPEDEPSSLVARLEAYGIADAPVRRDPQGGEPADADQSREPAES